MNFNVFEAYLWPYMGTISRRKAEWYSGVKKTVSVIYVYSQLLVLFILWRYAGFDLELWM
jgi:hypothetical protein